MKTNSQMKTGWRKSQLLAALAACAVALPAHGNPLPAPVAKAAPAKAQAATAPAQLVPVPPNPPTLRLPTGIQPLGYGVHLRLVPGAETFSGTVDIDLKVDAPPADNVLWLNGSSEVQVQSVSLKRAPQPQELAGETLRGGNDFIGFRLTAPLAKGSAHLQIHFVSKLLRHEGVGVFTEREGGDDYIFSDFEPFDARRAFPCFDEPAFKVPVQFTLDVPAAHLAATNAPVASETAIEEGFKRVVFRPTPPLPAYLWALAVGPFGVVDAGQGGSRKVPLRILTLRGHEADGRYAASVTAGLIEQLERYTGVPFPYDKLDQIGVPSQSHAMENPGLITYGLRLIQIGPTDDTVAARRRFAKVCAHELAHHWTGDLVTLRYWDDTWLNESFASFLQTKVTERSQPDWGEAEERVQSRLGAMDADSLLSARRIHQPITSRDDIVNAFDPITYAKGQAVLRMLEGWLGEELFARGLTRYLKQHLHGNATATDFISALAAETLAGGKRAEAAALPKVMESFLDQPGVPLVSLALDCGAGSARLRYRQRRYIPARGEVPEKERFTYRLPLCIETGPGRRQCSLLDAAAGDIVLSGGCPEAGQLIADPDVSAYARIQYDEALLGPLIERAFPAGPSSLTETQRLALLLDLGALLRAAELPADRLLAVVARAALAPGRHLPQSAARIVLGLRELVPTASHAPFTRFVLKTFTPRLQSLGLRSQPNESDDLRILRATLLPLVLGEAWPLEMQRQAEQLVVGWLSNRSLLDPESAHALLLATVQRGSRLLWEAVHQSLLKEKDRNVRSLFLDALGSFRDPLLVRASLALVLATSRSAPPPPAQPGQTAAPADSPLFEPREAMKILSGAASQPEGRGLAYQFVKAHFDELVARLPRDAGANLARVAGGFCDEAARADAEAFFTGRSTQYVGGPRVLSQTLERIAQCARLRQFQDEPLARFLSSF